MPEKVKVNFDYTVESVDFIEGYTDGDGKPLQVIKDSDGNSVFATPYYFKETGDNSTPIIADPINKEVLLNEKIMLGEGGGGTSSGDFQIRWRIIQYCGWDDNGNVCPDDFWDETTERIPMRPLRYSTSEEDHYRLVMDVDDDIRSEIHSVLIISEGGLISKAEQFDEYQTEFSLSIGGQYDHNVEDTVTVTVNTNDKTASFSFNVLILYYNWLAGGVIDGATIHRCLQNESEPTLIYTGGSPEIYREEPYHSFSFEFVADTPYMMTDSTRFDGSDRNSLVNVNFLFYIKDENGRFFNEYFSVTEVEYIEEDDDGNYIGVYLDFENTSQIYNKVLYGTVEYRDSKDGETKSNTLKFKIVPGYLGTRDRMGNWLGLYDLSLSNVEVAAGISDFWVLDASNFLPNPYNSITDFEIFNIKIQEFLGRYTSGSLTGITNNSYNPPINIPVALYDYHHASSDSPAFFIAVILPGYQKIFEEISYLNNGVFEIQPVTISLYRNGESIEEMRDVYYNVQMFKDEMPGPVPFFLSDEDGSEFNVILIPIEFYPDPETRYDYIQFSLYLTDALINVFSAGIPCEVIGSNYQD